MGTLEHMKKMKNNAIVGNIGHFDNEIHMAGLEKLEGMKVENIKAQVDRFVFPDVLLLHEPGAWTARSPEELERDEGLQERCLSLAQVSRRESRRAALTCAGRPAHGAHAGAGRLHRREGDRALQGRYLPVLRRTSGISR